MRTKPQPAQSLELLNCVAEQGDDEFAKDRAARAEEIGFAVGLRFTC